MATTRLEYTGDGNTVTFNLGTIDLINRSDLKVYIFEPSRDSNTAVLQSEATNAGTAGTSHPQYDASNTSGSNAGSIAATTPVNNYQFNSGNTQITLNTDNGVAKPTANAIITLERITSELQNDFSSQGTIRASELNSELRRIQHIAEEGVNEAKLSIKESRFSSNAVDVAHPTLGTDRRIEHVADADSDDDAVNREQLRKVIFDDLIEGEGINLTDATGGTNSNGQTTISGEDSSKTNKGIVKINEGEAIDVNYTDGNAVISSENSTKSNKGAITVNSGHGIKVGPSDESDAGYDGNAVVSADRSTPTAQGIIKVNQVSGDAINVSHAVGGTVGDVTIGVDRATASQQGVVKIASSVPITTTYTADGEVSLSIADNTVDLAKIRNDDVITSSELDASTTTSNYPTPDWDSDDSIATGKALAKRFDAIYYSHTTNKGTPPTETNWVEGKLWYDHLNDQTFSIWDKTGANTGVWRSITSGGTFTSQPKVVYVDSVNGNDLNDGHRIIKAKKTIRGALLDVNENISSTTTTNVTAATYNHQTGLLTVTTNAAHNLRVGMKVTMAGLVWSCNYGGGTNNHTFPEADDPLRFVSNILSNTQFECQLETTVDTTLAHTYVSGGTVTNQAGRVGQGWMISVAAGTYQEILPLRVEADNVSIVGTTMRSCFIHPSNTQRYDTSKDFNASDAVTSGTSEYNTMFEMNSGTYIWGFAFSGMKAGGWTTTGGSTASARGDATGYVPEANRDEQRTNVDPDATYGLPPVHGWIAAFRPNCSLKKSPYIQNCTSISDTDINNAAYDPVTQTGGLGGDKDSGMTAGGILVDGSVPSATSPLRSFVVDAFTQINMDGPGILCTNNGYAQLVSFFGTFCHYHAKSLNGGMLNLANCTTDYGRYGLIADGKSATTTFTSTVDGAKAAGQTSFNIDATTITSGYHGTGFNNSTANLRPGDNYLVKIGSDTYEIVSATPVGGSWTATNGWTVVIMKTNSTNPAINDGLTNSIADGATVSFYQRSYISTGGHTFEYVGAGTDYRAAPENGGVPIEANEVINRNNGKVWQSSTNHVGKFKVGETFTIDQRSGKVESKGITLTGPVTTNGNDNITIDPSGSGTVSIGSALAAGNTTVGTLGASGDVTFNTGNITTASNADITLTPNGSGKVVIDALNWPTADGTSNYFLQTNGSGQLQWAAAASTSSPTISNPTVTGNLVVTDNLRLNDDDDSHSITITAPTTVPSNVVLTLPSGAPSANQYLKAGASTPTNLEWENQLAITTVQTAANESAMLGLTTQEGDVVIRTDESKTYIKNSGTAGSMADFTHLVSPTGTVTTVDGHSGTVTANDIRDAVESATDSHTFTDADHTKLGNAALTTGASFTGDVTLTGADGNILWDTSETSLKIDDDVTTYWGDGADLQIEHFTSGSLSRIYSSATGGLDIKIVSGTLNFKSESGGSEQTGATYTPAAGWSFNHAGGARIATDAAGVDITGQLDVSGHVVLGDQKYAKFGVGSDLTVGHNDSTNINFVESNLSPLVLTTASDNPVKLQHSGSVKLATSSSGVDITGALTVNGAAVGGGGNSVDLVADGAIAAGKPVIITTAGKAQQAGIQTTTLTTPTFDGSSNIGNGDHGTNQWVSDGEWVASCWARTYGVAFVVCKNKNNSYDGLEGSLIKPNSGSATASNRVDSVNLIGTTYSGGQPNNNMQEWTGVDCAYDIANNKFAIVGKMDYDAKPVYTDVSTTADDNLSANNGRLYLDSSNTAGDMTESPCRVVYVGSGRMAFFWSHSGSNEKCTCRIGTWNGSNKYDLGTAVDLPDKTKRFRAAWHEATGKIVLVARCASSSGLSNPTIGQNDAFAMVGTISGTGTSATTTWATHVAFPDSAGASGDLDIITDDETDKLVIIRKEASGSLLTSNVASLSGTTLTIGNSVEVDTTTNPVSNQHDFPIRVVYHDGMKKVIASYASYDENSHYLKIGTVSTSSNTITWANRTQWASANGNQWNSPVVAYGDSQGTLLTSFIHTNSGGKGRTRQFKYISQATNLNANNAIGFAEDAISDTATGTINLPGNTVGNQSSLTTGTVYYIQPNGTLGTSQDNSLGAASGGTKAGIALSATSLLISDYKAS